LAYTEVKSWVLGLAAGHSDLLCYYT